MSAMLGKKGVTPKMVFPCVDCSEVTLGEQVLIDDARLYIVEENKASPINSTFRCECCQDDYEERNCTC